MQRNTLVTISDNKIGVDNTADNTADYYQARVLSATDYYAFGMAMKERTQPNTSYRYGFNGKENDTDWEVQDYGFRIYKPELAKFLSVDPLTQSYPWYTPYQFAGNSPILNIDLDGLEPYPSTNNLHRTKQVTKAFMIYDFMNRKSFLDDAFQRSSSGHAALWRYAHGLGEMGHNYSSVKGAIWEAFVAQQYFNVQNATMLQKRMPIMMRNYNTTINSNIGGIDVISTYSTNSRGNFAYFDFDIVTGLDADGNLDYQNPELSGIVVGANTDLVLNIEVKTWRPDRKSDVLYHSYVKALDDLLGRVNTNTNADGRRTINRYYLFTDAETFTKALS